MPGPDYHIGLYEGSNSRAWDSYVIHHKAGYYYHLSGWQEVIAGAYGLPTKFWWCHESSGEVVGVLPMVHVKHRLFGNSLVSMPYLDGGGILADTAAAKMKLFSAAQEFAARAGIPQIEWRGLNPEQAGEAGPTGIAAVGPTKVRMVLPLPENSEVLFNRFKSKLRSQLRKPLKAGLTFAWGGPEKIIDFYRVFKINMRDLGSPIHSQAFFLSLARIFKDYCQVGVVYCEGKPVAAGIIFGFGETVSVPWASSLRTYNHLAPNMLLYWEFLKYAADHNFTFFDFGRSSRDSGTYTFKQQWGAIPQPLNWQRLQLRPGKTGEGPRDRFSNFIKLWQKLPLPLTVFLGPKVRKYIAL